MKCIHDFTFGCNENSPDNAYERAKAEYKEYLRHYYAGQAVIGLLAAIDENTSIENSCILMVKIADELIKELGV